MGYAFYTESKFGLAIVQVLSRQIRPVITMLDGIGFGHHGIKESRSLFRWPSREGDRAKATVMRMDMWARVRRKPLLFSLLRLEGCLLEHNLVYPPDVKDQ